MSREPHISSGAGSKDQPVAGSAADATARTSLRSIIRVLAAQAARDDFRRVVSSGDRTVVDTSPLTSADLSGNG
ncbi:hypothetical protein ACMV_20180 [Acidiphilium multivorum AIU301]|uniref:Uncharacterized protein n=2 Tax=Acidiphilium multivorum TaxID=62140 RepID=F0J005_ACIMA|nr:hypothetical protein [Acidiphilium multivorum]BAJ81365.1 hypothetical protein ACMV_20180 [Acidiphilium multivorum AIU301]GAN75291.1 hypothetical protein Apmu_0318_02 [Acidiphilium multivorum AIU301]